MTKAVTLGEIAERLQCLEFGCSRCGRWGLLSVARLLANHTQHMPLVEVRQLITNDCTRIEAGELQEVCAVHFPRLVELHDPP